MKTYSRSEIMNKWGKPIYYFSKSPGNTDFEKFKNSFIYKQNSSEYIIQAKNDTLLVLLIIMILKTLITVDTL